MTISANSGFIEAPPISRPSRVFIFIISCVFAVCAASVEDSHFVGLVDVFVQSLPEPGENLKGLLGGGADAGSDGPDGFVGQDDVAVPVGAVFGEGCKERFELVVENIPGPVAISFWISKNKPSRVSPKQ